MTKQNTGFTTAHMDAKLHHEIKKEAARNGMSFSDQVKDYMLHILKLEEQIAELREEIRKLTDVN